jgi:hypothetical protein
VQHARDFRRTAASREMGKNRANEVDALVERGHHVQEVRVCAAAPARALPP